MALPALPLCLHIPLHWEKRKIGRLTAIPRSRSEWQMTTEVDFSLALQLAGSHLRQWLGFFLSLEGEGTGKKRKKRICQPVNCIYSGAVPELFLTGIPAANPG